MANNYLETSFVLECSQEELDAWEAIHEIAEALVDEDGDGQDLIDAYERQNDMQLVKAVHSAIAPDVIDEGGFNVFYTVERYDDGGGQLWFRSDESFDLEAAVVLLRCWLQQLGSERKVLITWANTCSKMRVGEFCGGGVIVTAEERYWFNGGYLAEVCCRGLDLPPAKELVESAMDEVGLSADAVLEALHSFLDKNPVAKHDFDAYLQRWVEDELEATDEKET